MTIANALQRALQFIWEGTLRLFSPDDNVYPVIGLQPFEGDPYDAVRARQQVL